MHDHLRSCKITWETKIIIYPLTQAYGHQFWQAGNIQWGIPFHKVTRSLNLVILQGHIKYFSCCITATTRPIATKLGKVVIYCNKLHKVLNTWSHDTLKTFYLHYHNTCGPQTWKLVTYNKELPFIKSGGLVILISPVRFVGLARKTPKSSPTFCF